jgi:hypothetical protein
MKTLLLIGLLFAGFVAPEPPNTLTASEKREGWALLFDGKTTTGWRGAYADAFPAKGWTVEDGMLTIQKAKASATS